MHRGNAKQLIFNIPGKGKGVSFITDQIFYAAYSLTEDLVCPVEGVLAGSGYLPFCRRPYRNSYIGWVNMAKSEETRKRRISEVVKRSSMNKKPGME